MKRQSPQFTALEEPPYPLLQSVGDKNALNGTGGAAVFVGTGVCTRDQLAIAVPAMDVLGLMLLTEHIRHTTGSRTILHLVADTHAMTSGWPVGAVNGTAHAHAAWYRAAARALHLSDYQVVLASQVTDPLHGALLHLTRTDATDPYAAREAADIEWARRTAGANVKVGWAMDARLEASGYDERHFDRVHAQIFGPTITPVYGYPGRTADPRRPRCNPYALLAGEQRAGLSATLPTLKRVCASRSMRRHLHTICECAEARLGWTGGNGVTERAARLLARIQDEYNLDADNTGVETVRVA